MAAEGDPEQSDAHAVMTILYLIEIPLNRAIKDPLPEEVADAAQQATKRAKEVADEYEDVEVRVEIERVRKKGTGIVFAARRLGVDAIVMGAEPPSPIKGGAQLGGIGDYRPEEIGPITAYVLKRAPCRVLLTAPGS
jgi:APA family basic amino acid/polyamine antiporter